MFLGKSSLRAVKISQEVKTVKIVVYHFKFNCKINILTASGENEGKKYTWKGTDIYTGKIFKTRVKSSFPQKVIHLMHLSDNAKYSALRTKFHRIDNTNHTILIFSPNLKTFVAMIYYRLSSSYNNGEKRESRNRERKAKRPLEQDDINFKNKIIQEVEYVSKSVFSVTVPAKRKLCKLL